MNSIHGYDAHCVGIRRWCTNRSRAIQSSIDRYLRVHVHIWKNELNRYLVHALEQPPIWAHMGDRRTRGSGEGQPCQSSLITGRRAYACNFAQVLKLNYTAEWYLGRRAAAPRGPGAATPISINVVLQKKPFLKGLRLGATLALYNASQAKILQFSSVVNLSRSKRVLRPVEKEKTRRRGKNKHNVWYGRTP